MNTAAYIVDTHTYSIYSSHTQSHIQTHTNTQVYRHSVRHKHNCIANSQIIIHISFQFLLTFLCGSPSLSLPGRLLGGRGSVRSKFTCQRAKVHKVHSTHVTRNDTIWTCTYTLYSVTKTVTNRAYFGHAKHTVYTNTTMNVKTIALKCKTLGGIRVQALDAGITQCDCFRYTCAYTFTACVKSTQNGRLPCARKGTL